MGFVMHRFLRTALDPLFKRTVRGYILGVHPSSSRTRPHLRGLHTPFITRGISHGYPPRVLANKNSSRGQGEDSILDWEYLLAITFCKFKVKFKEMFFFQMGNKIFRTCGFSVGDEGQFILDTDASNHGIGAVLSQIQDGVERVIAYYSHVLNDSENNYCVTRELLAIVDSLKLFHHYLYGCKFLRRDLLIKEDLKCPFPTFSSGNKYLLVITYCCTNKEMTPIEKLIFERVIALQNLVYEAAPHMNRKFTLVFTISPKQKPIHLNLFRVFIFYLQPIERAMTRLKIDFSISIISLCEEYRERHHLLLKTVSLAAFEPYERYERALVKGHKQTLDRRNKENLSTDIHKYKSQVIQSMQEGNKLSPGEARKAFGLYLGYILRKISQPNADPAYCDLIMKFLQHSSCNLRTPFLFTLPCNKLSMKDRAAITAKQLSDFLHLYNRETDLYEDTVDRPRTVSNKVFQKFLAAASEQDLDDVLILQTRLYKCTHSFLGKSGFVGTLKGANLLGSLPHITSRIYSNVAATGQCRCNNSINR
ncbi:hypothetical protein ACFW04_011368 [Cataglyphis niger]